MGTNVPDLSGGGAGNPNIGNKGGVPNGPVAPNQPIAVTAAQPGSPQKLLQTRWRPASFVDFHQQMLISPSQASKALDNAIQRAYQNSAKLESMVAATQFGQATVTGNAKSISTGLASISQVTASIDNGSTPHNFTISAVVSQQPGCVDLYVFQPTSTTNNTPVAGTTAVVVRWSARGSVT